MKRKYNWKEMVIQFLNQPNPKTPGKLLSTFMILQAISYIILVFAAIITANEIFLNIMYLIMLIMSIIITIYLVINIRNGIKHLKRINQVNNENDKHNT